MLRTHGLLWILSPYSYLRGPSAMEGVGTYLWDWAWAVGLLISSYAGLSFLHFCTRRGAPCAVLEKARRVLLLIAHPDDECMFFGPTVVGLLGRGGHPKRLFLVCLSTGKFELLKYICIFF